jgi:16S rRNA (guanine(966)-N(2))-methyltransferase RsmD
MTRIISGKHRGRRIAAPKNLPTRPTTDMAKESLFNILNNHFYLDDIRFLDLCAGTGNISYELASRGCTNITAVDADHACVKFIEKVASDLSFEGFSVVKSDVLDFIAKDYKTYDLIFADPPFDYQPYEKLVDQIFFKNLLDEEGLLVIEHQSRTSLEHLPHFFESRKYGNVSFSFFKKEADKED